MAKSFRESRAATHAADVQPAEVAAPITTLALRAKRSMRVPLSALYLHARNVRSQELNPPSPEGIASLAALIDAQSLLSALQVVAEVDGKGVGTGRYGVVAGGRRWRALGLLVQQGKLSPDALIDCDEVEDAEAVAVSLAENVSQEPMHPADEFAAFHELALQGRSPEQIAAQFGYKLLHVRQRLKLAGVALELMALFRNHKLTLDQVEAFAGVDDQQRQLAVWKGLPAYSRQAASIRAALAHDEVSTKDARARFVGQERYRASGGEVRQDLFASEHFLTDSGLVELLVAEILEEQAEPVRQEGWAWVEVLPGFGHEERQRFIQPPLRYRAATAEEEAREKALQAEDDDLDGKIDDAWDSDEDEDEEETDAKVQAWQQRREQIEAELDALHVSQRDTSAADRSVTGAVVYRDGDKVAVQRGLMTMEQARQFAARVKAEGGEVRTVSGATIAPLPDKSEKAEFSERLMMSLTAHHTAAVQASLLSQPAIALAVLAHRFTMALLHHGYLDHPVKVSLTDSAHTLKTAATTLAQCRAGQVMADEEQRWKERLPEDSDTWLGWFLAQPMQVSVDAIVFGTARSLNGLSGRFDPTRTSILEPLSQALALDMANWWEPTADTYLGLVPKAKMADAVAQACGTEAGAEVAGLKKAEAITASQTSLQGKRWLPAPLRPAQAPQAVDQDAQA